ncbi:hypothetical protein [Gelidibacter pelagius]|uniref:GLPGLI family protein n=1 Tax=Gelidibacter pelagius TaxID=2819985 RepID=A0ABS3SYC7_9FLAO|nr:hypothetical protein [Gelidibacter pelagius]MBO3100281.1 hypothetical protein [Gelidibacter pelagius]
MKKTINILIIIFLFSCSDTTKKETQRTETRNLTVFEFDSLVSKADYELSIRERDSVIIYNYKNINDSTKNKDFRYLKHSDQLLAGPFEFKKTENHHYPTFENFNYYDSDPGIMDGMGPVIFNDEFGVLGFDNGMGTQYYFTNDSIGKIELPILYKQTELNVTDNIPQGKFKYEIYFAEFGGRMPN